VILFDFPVRFLIPCCLGVVIGGKGPGCPRPIRPVLPTAGWQGKGRSLGGDAAVGSGRDLEGRSSNLKRRGEWGRQAVSDLLAQVFKGSCFAGGGDRETWN